MSVLLVTLGVILTTFSAAPSSSQVKTSGQDTWNYIIGLMILSLALVFGGLLGLAQDWTYTTYGRPQPSVPKPAASTDSQPPQWQESLFYLHFLSLPMFVFLRQDIETQFRAVSTGPKASWSAPLPVPSALSTSLLNASSLSNFISFTQAPQHNSPLTFSFHIPYAFVPLLLNTITQLLCVSGVHRLTTRVSSLTVTLVLVVRKAVSLLISVLGAGVIPGVGGGKARTVDQKMMWSGAALVLLGTILYSIGTGRKGTGVKQKSKKE